MASELINYLKDEKYLNLEIESVTETFELYNYDVRLYGTVNNDYAINNRKLKLPKNFELRVALYEDGALGIINGNCTFFDPVAHHDLAIYLEIGRNERTTLVTMIKETLSKFDVAKLSLEIDNTSFDSDKMEDNFIGTCVDLINIKMTLDSGKRRNFFWNGRGFMKSQFILFMFFLFINTIVVSQSILPLDNSNLHKDGAGNIINLTTGTVYKDLGNGTVIDLNSGDIFKKIDDGTVIKLESEIKVPIIK